eukprot:UN30456
MHELIETDNETGDETYENSVWINKDKSETQESTSGATNQYELSTFDLPTGDGLEFGELRYIPRAITEDEMKNIYDHHASQWPVTQYYEFLTPIIVLGVTIVIFLFASINNRRLKVDKPRFGSIRAASLAVMDVTSDYQLCYFLYQFGHFLFIPCLVP